MTSPIGDPLVGRTIAHYEVVARVGGGAMGVVYQARDTKLGRRVALKFLPQQWSHDETAKQRFVREAQAASATNHPNICTIHDIETADDGQLFIVMAYYEGPTLKQRLESGPIPVEEALEIATQIADGLAKAHAEGVVHRDVKPGNVILTDEGARILDFGLATFVDALKLTTENATIGTPAYMSPEQVQGRNTDARSDVWAVGVVLYEMLAGHVPFRGAYAEAVAHAIRHEAPEALRSIRPETPEDVEQLVFRALHKDPTVRVASGRELARALRQVRGLSASITQPILVSQPAPPVAQSGRTRRRGMAAAFALVAAVVAGAVWLAWPVERVLVAIVPFVNDTSYSELDAYRLPLTEELGSQLIDLSAVRVLPHERLLQIIRSFRQEGRNVSSRDALQAIATQSGARFLIVPTLSYKDGAWLVRVEFRNPATGRNQGVFETMPEKSSLMKDAVYRQVAGLQIPIDDYFTGQAPVRVRVTSAVRGWLGRTSQPRRARFRTLDAAAAFEGGIDAYEQAELAAARSAFANAAEQDPRSPLSHAWQSRMAALMRLDREAVEAVDRARQLLNDDSSESDRAFVEAVAAEARRDPMAAERGYRQLVARYPDEPAWLIELGGFQDRNGAATEAVETYHRALSLDSRLIRPHLELCRMYSPSRLNEPALAKEQGQATLKLARELRNEGAETQALWCLTDVLRSGDDADRLEARRHAEAALAIMDRLKRPFGIARAYNYVAIVALLAEKDAARARPLFDRTLTAARSVGFVLLEARALMNLGAALEMLGERSAALDHFRASFKLSETLGNQQDAAWNQVNIGAILVDFGDDPDAGLRETQNALGVFRDREDADFEAFARQIMASHYRHVGQYEDAIRQVMLGLNLASGRDLDDKVTQLTIEHARVRFDRGEYAQALELLREADRNAAGLNGVHVRVGLGRTRTRLGDFVAARAELDRAAADIERSKDSGSLPVLHAALGELAYEMGQLTVAQSYFRQASAAWRAGELPEDASVESRAYLGWLESAQGASARGTPLLLESLQRARRTRRITIEARCLLFLARVALRAGGVEEAVRWLGELSHERRRAVSLELQAQIRYWQGQALAKRGDREGSATEIAGARAMIDEWRRTLPPEAGQASVLVRPDIRLINGDDPATRP